MNIGGLATMTLLDYPGKVAATVFTNGCNFRCPFCQNGDLVLNDLITSDSLSENDILSFLKKRQGLLDGVCISGGEPTLQPDLRSFISKIKSLGYLIKLDTNGTNPKLIEELVSEKHIDYIAMDIKGPLDKYEIAAGFPVNTDNITSSIEFIINSNIEYEFRTTLVKGIHILEDMEAMALSIKGAKRYFLQSYKDSDRIIAKLNGNNSYSEFSKEELADFLLIVKKIIPEAKLRGID